MSNAALGGAEPCLWDRPDNPAITDSAGRFVKEVWPAFRAAGSRPRAGPILLPILADSPAWDGQRPEVRLAAFVNL